MYYAITSNGVITTKDLKSLNKQLNSKIEDIETYAAGSDKVVKLSDNDIEFVQDKKRLSLIPITKLYKEDKIITYVYIMIAMLAIIIIRG